MFSNLGQKLMSFGDLRKTFAVVTAFAALTVLTPATASATTTPAPGYEQFAGCPHPGEMTIETCVRTIFTGGELQMGTREIPIENPVTFSGGVTPAGKFGASPQGGLLPAKQTVPAIA
ncbi:MAG: hypothetical protein WA687_09535 [Solirubrobacterales bacterium]